MLVVDNKIKLKKIGKWKQRNDENELWILSINNMGFPIMEYCLSVCVRLS